MPVLYRKKCGSCKIEFATVPSKARYQGGANGFQGWYWECACGSTVFQPGHDCGRDADEIGEEEAAQNLKDRLSGSRYT